MTDEAAGAAGPQGARQTGVDVPEVHAARERLAALTEAPIHEHPQIYDDVQRLLTSALDPHELPHAQPAGR